MTVVLVLLENPGTRDGTQEHLERTQEHLESPANSRPGEDPHQPGRAQQGQVVGGKSVEHLWGSSSSWAPAAPGLQLEFPDWPQLTPEDQRPLAVHSW